MHNLVPLQMRIIIVGVQSILFLIKDIKFLIISNSNQNALKQFLIYVDDKRVVGFFANEQAVAYFEFCILLRKFALRKRDFDDILPH